MKKNAPAIRASAMMKRKKIVISLLIGVWVLVVELARVAILDERKKKIK